MAASKRLAADLLAGLSVLGIAAMIQQFTRTRGAKRRLQEAHAEEEAASHARLEFLEHMHHELRTPLNAIIGFSNILLKNKRGALSAKELNYASRIAVNGTQLLELIDELLRFVPREAERSEFILRTISARELLASVDELMAPLAQASDITFVVQPVDESVHVFADRERVQHILLNLVTNAINFTPGGGHVTLACEASDGRVDIHVSDDGSGMSAETLLTLFEPFSRTGRTFKQAAVGIRLGLAISRDLARGMGGDLDVVSAEGWGSTFTLRLRVGGS
jgi:signal transduction histidine kinase